MIEQTDIINELWRSISGYMNYQISNIGRVRNTETGRILKNGSSNGYHVICLKKNGDKMMHRVHMLVAQEFLDKPDVEYKLVVDHIDRNTINNQVTNLRYVSMTQNSMNKSKKHNGTSICKGVCWDRFRNKRKAQIVVDKRKINLGHFDSEIEAALKYDEAAKEYYKEYSCTNNLSS